MKRSVKVKAIIVSFLMLANILLSSCSSSQHVEKSYTDNDNASIVGWGDADKSNANDWDNTTIQTWDNVDDYTDWIYSSILFSGITEDYPIVGAVELDYKSNGSYFDGDALYELVEDRFDANAFISKYAIGTGVIVICVVMTVMVSGAPRPIVCFITGARDMSVKMATKGAAFGGAINAVKEYIRTGDFEDALYGMLEGSADGYMWGAIFGAITGGFSSKYCLTGDTLVQTVHGPKCISDVQIGEQIYSYNEDNGMINVDTVTQVIHSNSTQIVELIINDETIRTTPSHPFLSENGWVSAGALRQGDNIITTNGIVTVDSINTCHLVQPMQTYNLCVEKDHNFIVGENSIVVHNVCRTAPNQKYAGKRVHFDDPEWIADHPSKTPAQWKALAKKYPNGIYFKPVDAHGVSYPDFSEYAEDIVEFEYPSKVARAANKCLTGDRGHDNSLADKAKGITEQYRQKNALTWNHNENMKTLELIPKDIHEAVSHNGGAKLIIELFKKI